MDAGQAAEGQNPIMECLVSAGIRGRSRQREYAMSSDPKPRSVIHLDLDAFYASVEELLEPAMAGLPILVGGSPQGRGVVSSASYPARKYGVHSAMPMSQALRLCPDAVVRRGHFREYASYSERVMAILSEYTPLVEQISVDEAFLDVTGCERLFGPAQELAHKLQRRIQSEMGLPASLGVASNKLVAKIASAQAKPQGVLVIPAGDEARFLAGLPVECLWGVGEVTAERLKAAGVATIGQLASCPEAMMRALLGSGAAEMRRRALGVDGRAVGHSGRRKSISQEHTFEKDVDDLAVLRRVLLRMSENVAAQLRKRGTGARTIVLKMRYPDFHTITRRTTLEQPTTLAEVIHSEAVQLLQKQWSPGVRVRLLGVGATALVEARQLGLFEWHEERLGKLSRVVDDIRRKHGRKAIRRASLLDNDGR
jgi:DNA polymerase-4